MWLTPFSPQRPRDNGIHLANLPPLDKLTVRKLIVNVPIIFAGSWRAKPPTKMRGHRMEVDAQAVSGESEDTIRMQTFARTRTSRDRGFPDTSSTALSSDAPQCPKCRSAMVLRTARSGANAGNRCWLFELPCLSFDNAVPGLTETHSGWRSPGTFRELSGHHQCTFTAPGAKP